MQVLDPELASVVWWGTHTLRVRAHAARGASLCPTRFAPYGHADPLAQQANLRCWEDGCMGIAVSYTHLDVYKRQLLRRPDPYPGLIRTKPDLRGGWTPQVTSMMRSARAAYDCTSRAFGSSTRVIHSSASAGDLPKAMCLSLIHI